MKKSLCFVLCQFTFVISKKSSYETRIYYSPIDPCDETINTISWLRNPVVGRTCYGNAGTHFDLPSQADELYVFGGNFALPKKKLMCNLSFVQNSINRIYKINMTCSSLEYPKYLTVSNFKKFESTLCTDPNKISDKSSLVLGEDVKVNFDIVDNDYFIISTITNADDQSFKEIKIQTYGRQGSDGCFDEKSFKVNLLNTNSVFHTTSLKTIGKNKLVIAWKEEAREYSSQFVCNVYAIEVTYDDNFENIQKTDPIKYNHLTTNECITKILMVTLGKEVVIIWKATKLSDKEYNRHVGAVLHQKDINEKDLTDLYNEKCDYCNKNNKLQTSGEKINWHNLRNLSTKDVTSQKKIAEDVTGYSKPINRSVAEESFKFHSNQKLEKVFNGQSIPIISVTSSNKIFEDYELIQQKSSELKIMKNEGDIFEQKDTDGLQSDEMNFTELTASSDYYFFYNRIKYLDYANVFNWHNINMVINWNLDLWVKDMRLRVLGKLFDFSTYYKSVLNAEENITDNQERIQEQVKGVFSRGLQMPMAKFIDGVMAKDIKIYVEKDSYQYSDDNLNEVDNIIHYGTIYAWLPNTIYNGDINPYKLNEICVQVVSTFVSLKIFEVNCWVPKYKNGEECKLGFCYIGTLVVDVFYENTGVYAILTYGLVEIATKKIELLFEILKLKIPLAKPLINISEIFNASDSNKPFDFGANYGSQMSNTKSNYLGKLITNAGKEIHTIISINIPYYYSEELFVVCHCEGIPLCGCKPPTNILDNQLLNEIFGIDPEKPIDYDPQNKLCYIKYTDKFLQYCDLRTYNPFLDLTKNHKRIRIMTFEKKTKKLITMYDLLLNISTGGDSYLSNPAKPHILQFFDLEPLAKKDSIMLIKTYFRDMARLPNNFISSNLTLPVTRFITNLSFQVLNEKEMYIGTGSIHLSSNLGYYQIEPIVSDPPAFKNTFQLKTTGLYKNLEVPITLVHINPFGLPIVCLAFDEQIKKKEERVHKVDFSSLCLVGIEYQVYIDFVNSYVIVLIFTSTYEEGLAIFSGFAFPYIKTYTLPAYPIVDFIRGIIMPDGLLYFEISEYYNGKVTKYAYKKYILELSFGSTLLSSSSMILKGHDNSLNAVTFVKPGIYEQYDYRNVLTLSAGINTYLAPYYQSPFKKFPILITPDLGTPSNKIESYDFLYIDKSHRKRFAFLYESSIKSDSNTDVFITYWLKVQGDYYLEDFPIRLSSGNSSSTKNQNPVAINVNLWESLFTYHSSSAFINLLYSNISNFGENYKEFVKQKAQSIDKFHLNVNNMKTGDQQFDIFNYVNDENFAQDHIHSPNESKRSLLEWLQELMKTTYLFKSRRYLQAELKNCHFLQDGYQNMENNFNTSKNYTLKVAAWEKIENSKSEIAVRIILVRNIDPDKDIMGGFTKISYVDLQSDKDLYKEQADLTMKVNEKVSAECFLKNENLQNVNSSLCNLALYPKFRSLKEPLGISEYVINDGTSCKKAQPNLWGLGSVVMACYWRGKCDVSDTSNKWTLVCQVLWIKMKFNSIRPYQQEITQLKLTDCSNQTEFCNENGLEVANEVFSDEIDIPKSFFSIDKNDKDILKIKWKQKESSVKERKYSIPKFELIDQEIENIDQLDNFDGLYSDKLNPTFKFIRSPTLSQLATVSNFSRIAVVYLKKEGDSGCTLWTGARHAQGQQIEDFVDIQVGKSSTLTCKIQDIKMFAFSGQFQYVVSYKDNNQMVYTDHFKVYQKIPTGIAIYSKFDLINPVSKLKRKFTLNIYDNLELGSIYAKYGTVTIDEINKEYYQQLRFVQAKDDCRGLKPKGGKCFTVMPHGKVIFSGELDNTKIGNERCPFKFYIQHPKTIIEYIYDALNDKPFKKDMDLINNYLRYTCDSNSSCDCCCVYSDDNTELKADCIARKKQKLMIETAVVMLANNGSSVEKKIMHDLKGKIKESQENFRLTCSLYIAEAYKFEVNSWNISFYMKTEGGINKTTKKYNLQIDRGPDNTCNSCAPIWDSLTIPPSPKRKEVRAIIDVLKYNNRQNLGFNIELKKFPQMLDKDGGLIIPCSDNPYVRFTANDWDQNLPFQNKCTYSQDGEISYLKRRRLRIQMNSPLKIRRQAVASYIKTHINQNKRKRGLLADNYSKTNLNFSGGWWQAEFWADSDYSKNQGLTVSISQVSPMSGVSLAITTVEIDYMVLKKRIMEQSVIDSITNEIYVELEKLESEGKLDMKELLKPKENKKGSFKLPKYALDLIIVISVINWGFPSIMILVLFIILKKYRQMYSNKVCCGYLTGCQAICLVFSPLMVFSRILFLLIKRKLSHTAAIDFDEKDNDPIKSNQTNLQLNKDIIKESKGDSKKDRKKNLFEKAKIITKDVAGNKQQGQTNNFYSDIHGNNNADKVKIIENKRDGKNSSNILSKAGKKDEKAHKGFLPDVKLKTNDNSEKVTSKKSTILSSNYQTVSNSNNNNDNSIKFVSKSMFMDQKNNEELNDEELK